MLTDFVMEIRSLELSLPCVRNSTTIYDVFSSFKNLYPAHLPPFDTRAEVPDYSLWILCIWNGIPKSMIHMDYGFIMLFFGMDSYLVSNTSVHFGMDLDLISNPFGHTAHV